MDENICIYVVVWLFCGAMLLVWEYFNRRMLSYKVRMLMVELYFESRLARTFPTYAYFFKWFSEKVGDPFFFLTLMAILLVFIGSGLFASDFGFFTIDAGGLDSILTQFVNIQLVLVGILLPQVIFVVQIASESKGTLKQYVKMTRPHSFLAKALVIYAITLALWVVEGVAIEEGGLDFHPRSLFAVSVICLVYIFYVVFRISRQAGQTLDSSAVSRLTGELNWKIIRKDILREAEANVGNNILAEELKSISPGVRISSYISPDVGSQMEVEEELFVVDINLRKIRKFAKKLNTSRFEILSLYRMKIRRNTIICSGTSQSQGVDNLLGALKGQNPMGSEATRGPSLADISSLAISQIRADDYIGLEESLNVFYLVFSEYLKLSNRPGMKLDIEQQKKRPWWYWDNWNSIYRAMHELFRIVATISDNSPQSLEVFFDFLYRLVDLSIEYKNLNFFSTVCVASTELYRARLSGRSALKKQLTKFIGNVGDRRIIDMMEQVTENTSKNEFDFLLEISKSLQESIYLMLKRALDFEDQESLAEYVLIGGEFFTTLDYHIVSTENAYWDLLRSNEEEGLADQQLVWLGMLKTLRGIEVEYLSRLRVFLFGLEAKIINRCRIGKISKESASKMIRSIWDHIGELVHKSKTVLTIDNFPRVLEACSKLSDSSNGIDLDERPRTKGAHTINDIPIIVNLYVFRALKLFSEGKKIVPPDEFINHMLEDIKASTEEFRAHQGLWSEILDLSGINFEEFISAHESSSSEWQTREEDKTIASSVEQSTLLTIESNIKKAALKSTIFSSIGWASADGLNKAIKQSIVLSTSLSKQGVIDINNRNDFGKYLGEDIAVQLDELVIKSLNRSSKKLQYKGSATQVLESLIEKSGVERNGVIFIPHDWKLTQELSLSPYWLVRDGVIFYRDFHLVQYKINRFNRAIVLSVGVIRPILRSNLFTIDVEQDLMKQMYYPDEHYKAMYKSDRGLKTEFGSFKKFLRTKRLMLFLTFNLQFQLHLKDARVFSSSLTLGE